MCDIHNSLALWHVGGSGRGSTARKTTIGDHLVVVRVSKAALLPLSSGAGKNSALEVENSSSAGTDRRRYY